MEAITDETHDTITVANDMFVDMCAQDTKSNSSGITVLHEKCSKEIRNGEDVGRLKIWTLSVVSGSRKKENVSEKDPV
jgi:hypothetical protein